MADDGERRLFSGTAEQIVADLNDLQQLGVSHVDFGFAGDTTEELIATMQANAASIIRKTL